MRKIVILWSIALVGLGCLLYYAYVSRQSEKIVASQHAQAPQHDALPEIGMGSSTAPVQIILYTAFTCTHCADFHNDVLPSIKKAYIDTGKVRLILRDFPIDRTSLKESAIAWCAGSSRYLGLMDQLFVHQSRWLVDNAEEALIKFGGTQGLDRKQCQVCMSDSAILDPIVASRQDAEKKHKIDRTPTLIVGDKVIPYGISFEIFQAMVDPLLKKKS